MTFDGQTTCSRGQIWGGVLLPVGLLAVEALGLSLVVELETDAVLPFNGPPVFTGLVVAGVVYVILAAHRIEEVARESNPPPTGPWGWLVLHGLLFSLVAGLSLRLEATPRTASLSRLEGMSWLALVVVTGLSGLTIVWAPRALGRLLGQTAGPLAIAVLIGVFVAAVGPWFDLLWRSGHTPITRIVARLLDAYPGESIVLPVSESCPDPRIGVPGLLLRVTPQCSELNLLPTFWVLASVVFLVRRRCRPSAIAAVLVTGTGVMLAWIAARLWVLVVVGRWWGPGSSVALAHSRVGWLLGLILALGVLLLGARRRESGDASSPRSGAPDELVPHSSPLDQTVGEPRP